MIHPYHGGLRMFTNLGLVVLEISRGSVLILVTYDATVYEVDLSA